MMTVMDMMSEIPMNVQVFMFTYSLKEQPFIGICGPIDGNECFVDFFDHQYSCATLTEAMDICFRSVYGLAKYFGGWPLSVIAIIYQIISTRVLMNTSFAKIVKMQNLIDKEILRLALLLYANPSIPRNLVQEILQLMDNFIDNVLFPHLLEEIMKTVHESLDKRTVETIAATFEASKSLFKKYINEKSAFNMFEEHSYYVRPQTFEMGSEKIFEIVDHQTLREKTRTITGVHISLSDTLKILLEHADIFEQIIENLKSIHGESNVISYIRHGNLFKRKYDLTLTETPKTSTCFLATIYSSKDRKICGSEALFQKVIADINSLSDHGILINVKGKRIRVYSQCILHTGDNQGLSEDLGFVESYVAYRFCRICRATKCQCKEMTVEDPTLIRSKESYDNDVFINRPFVTGVNKRSALNDIREFHAAENKVLDLMHDCGEGQLPLVMSKVLTYFIRDAEFFDLETLNKIMLHFPYDSPRFVESDALGLEYMVEHFLDHFIKLYNETIPKLHHLVHYMRMILDNGPPINFWGMMGERRNKEMKDWVSTSKSNKNVPLTMAIRDQLRLCHYLESNEKHEKIVPGQLEQIDEFDLKLDSSIASFKYIDVIGKRYKRNSIFVLEVRDDDEPVFGRVHKIY
ncbi:hypothetical protein QAD02_019133 [Eretmocerus hayati]|uniref:Uncharacterized protein n=1 Tax=Eretmocerus hayati TaxID=131215 RepID=A0ACC2PJX5_9HYME|nr:hypothetical protein QAD02_019133 [Eretmocerus hayati]